MIAAPKRFRSSLVHAAAGFVVALGAPLGLLLVRAGLAGQPNVAYALQDVRELAPVYLYVTVSTIIAFMIFGIFTGRQADELVRLSRIDHLTGLLNRRALEERVHEERERSARRDASFAFLLVDVDGLKVINDREGHRGGDQALRQVAAVLNDACRSADACARWGGDEFAVLAAPADQDHAKRLAERIRVGVEARGRGVTISIGFATLQPSRETGRIDDVFARADAALYRAKREGRNRVHAYEPEPSS